MGNIPYRQHCQQAQSHLPQPTKQVRFNLPPSSSIASGSSSGYQAMDARKKTSRDQAAKAQSASRPVLPPVQPKRPTAPKPPQAPNIQQQKKQVRFAVPPSTNYSQSSKPLPQKKPPKQSSSTQHRASATPPQSSQRNTNLIDPHKLPMGPWTSWTVMNPGDGYSWTRVWQRRGHA